MAFSKTVTGHLHIRSCTFVFTFDTESFFISFFLDGPGKPADIAEFFSSNEPFENLNGDLLFSNSEKIVFEKITSIQRIQTPSIDITGLVTKYMIYSDVHIEQYDRFKNTISFEGGSMDALAQTSRALVPPDVDAFLRGENRAPSFNDPEKLKFSGALRNCIPGKKCGVEFGVYYVTAFDSRDVQRFDFGCKGYEIIYFDEGTDFDPARLFGIYSSTQRAVSVVCNSRSAYIECCNFTLPVLGSMVCGSIFARPPKDRPMGGDGLLRDFESTEKGVLAAMDLSFLGRFDYSIDFLREAYEERFSTARVYSLFSAVERCLSDRFKAEISESRKPEMDVKDAVWRLLSDHRSEIALDTQEKVAFFEKIPATLSLAITGTSGAIRRVLRDSGLMEAGKIDDYGRRMNDYRNKLIHGRDFEGFCISEKDLRQYEQLCLYLMMYDERNEFNLAEFVQKIVPAM